MESSEFRRALEEFKATAFEDEPAEKKAKLEGSVSEEAGPVPRFDDHRLEELLETVAREGRTEVDWDLLQPALLWKLEAVGRWMMALPQTHPAQPSPNLREVTASDFLQRLLSAARHLSAAPFTIQRLAELLTQPSKHYSRWDKLFRALEKTLSVVTTVNPQGLKEAGRPAQPPVHLHQPHLPDTPRLSAADSNASAGVVSSASSDQTLVLDPATRAPSGEDSKEEEEQEQISPGEELPNMEGEAESSTTTQPRPNVRISTAPVSRPPPPQPLEISVEVEECGEVKEAPEVPTEAPTDAGAAQPQPPADAAPTAPDEPIQPPPSQPEQSEQVETEPQIPEPTQPTIPETELNEAEPKPQPQPEHPDSLP